MLDAEKLQQLKDENIISEEELVLQKQRLASKVMNNHSVHKPKNGIIYIILAFFFGAIGVHNFYAGYWKRGLIQFLLALISPYMMFLPLLFTSFWAMLELLVVNKGANEEFFGGNKNIIWGLRIVAVIVVAWSLMSINTSFYDINVETLTEI